MIIRKLLQQYFLQFALLEDADQNQLVNTNYSQTLYDSWVKEPDNKLCYQKWLESFQKDAGLLTLRQSIQIVNANLQEQLYLLLPFVKHEIFSPLITLIYNELSTAESKKALLKSQWQPILDRNYHIWGESDRNQYWQKLSFNNALSWIMSQTVPENLPEYRDRMADAHMFFRWMGVSTERGAFELGIIDFYNYHRHQGSIAKLKAVFYALVRPLHAFFHEYVDIAQYEKNTFMIMFRIFMPIFVMAICLTFSFSLMAPFAVHELLELFMLIPSLYLGLAAGSAYVELKNYSFSAFMAWWWDGIYNAPQFQVNERMRLSFPEDENLAKDVAQFYTERLKDCEKIEREFASLALGTLTTEQLKKRTDNLEKRSALLREWYDIHTNDALGCDEVPSLVSMRLYEEGKHAYEILQQEVPICIDQYIDELENPQRPTIERYRLFFRPSDSVQRLAQDCAHHQQALSHIESVYSRLNSPV
jgi:hypothetical protein